MVWQRPGGGAFRGGNFLAGVNQPVAVAEAGKGRSDEIGLIGSKRREVPDPRAADAEAEKHQGQNAACRWGDGAKDASNDGELLGALAGSIAYWFRGTGGA